MLRNYSWISALESLHESSFVSITYIVQRRVGYYLMVE